MVGLIHDNTQVPLMDSFGFNLIPGQKHKLGYRKKTNFFLSSPFTPCTDKVSLWMQSMLNNYPVANYGYSQDLCYLLSLQIYT